MFIARDPATRNRIRIPSRTFSNVVFNERSLSLQYEYEMMPTPPGLFISKSAPIGRLGATIPRNELSLLSYKLSHGECAVLLLLLLFRHCVPEQILHNGSPSQSLRATCEYRPGEATFDICIVEIRSFQIPHLRRYSTIFCSRILNYKFWTTVIGYILFYCCNRVI